MTSFRPDKCPCGLPWDKCPWNIWGNQMSYIKSSLEDVYRIFDSIKPDEYGCHNWPGVNGKARIGQYGLIKIDNQQHRVHRLALERKLGRPIKPGMHALHTCDWPSCVNEDHLYEGTPGDNVCDMMERNPERWDYTRTPEHREKARQLMYRLVAQRNV